MIDSKSLNFAEIFEKSDNILRETLAYSNNDGTFDVNLSSILTILIQTADRYCESYASDLFIDWEDVKKFIDFPPIAGNQKLFIFGFRKSGVDHEAYVRNSSCSGLRYRKVFALKVNCLHEGGCQCDKLIITLKDITNDCIGITD